MEVWLILAIYAFGVVLILAEVFIPGIFVSILGLLAMGTSIYFAFADHGTLFGILLLLVTVFGLPVGAYFGLKRLSLKRSLVTQEGYKSARPDLEELLGQEGTVVTDLRPSGTVKIGDRKVDVVTRGEMIEKNSPVKVIKIEGVRVVVKRL